MKNVFVKNREKIIVAIISALGCVLMFGIVFFGIRDMQNISIDVDDYIEDVELTDEMVEAYRVLVLSGMGD